MSYKLFSDLYHMNTPPPLFCFGVVETEPCVVQVGTGLTVLPRTTVNSELPVSTANGWAHS